MRLPYVRRPRWGWAPTWARSPSPVSWGLGVRVKGGFSASASAMRTQVPIKNSWEPSLRVPADIHTSHAATAADFQEAPLLGSLLAVVPSCAAQGECIGEEMPERERVSWCCCCMWAPK